MRTRKTKEIKKVLSKKGFVLNPEKDHHIYYNLHVDGKKSHIQTYLSHNGQDYNPFLMDKIKKQLKFTDSKKAEDFFDCPLTAEMYIAMLKENGDIK